MITLFAFVALAALITVPVAAQECPTGFDCSGMGQPAQRVVHQFELLKGVAQIGHTPGRIDVLRPDIKTLAPAQHVSFGLTVRWAEKGYNPCGEAEGCVVTVGLRNRAVGSVATWSSFVFRTDANPLMRLYLPCLAGDSLPDGYHDVFVRITGRGHTLGVWYVPVLIGEV